MTTSLNPYAAPTSSLDESLEAAPDLIVPAGHGARILNLFIDYVAQIAISVVVGVVMVVIGGEAGARFIEESPDLLIGLPILLGYYFVLEATTGRTLGKLITGTKVVNEFGGKASVGQILGRTLARLIPFEVFSFLGSSARGWHDSLPKTYVIKSR